MDTQKDVTEPPDLRGPAVVVRGSVLGGFKFHGPFATIDAACEWCQTKTIDGVLGVNHDTIVLLEVSVDVEMEAIKVPAEVKCFCCDGLGGLAIVGSVGPGISCGRCNGTGQVPHNVQR